MKGLDIYKTQDGFTVARLHYTADKARCSPEWLAEAVKGFPRGFTGPAWRKEMEIDFTAYSGQFLCYYILAQYRNKIIKDINTDDWFKYGSVDWGRNNPACFHIYAVGEKDPETKKYPIHSEYEIYLRDTSIPDFCSLIKMSPSYKKLHWISADPSMWNRNQETKTGLRSLNDMFMDNGVVLRKGMSRHDQVAIAELLDRWYDLDHNEATFTISPRCPKQIWEFERLRYQEITTAMIERKNASEQLIDKDNHCYCDKTEILTNNGWKLFKDLKDEEVAVWDKGYLRYEKPKVISNNYSGDMYSYNNQSISFSVTKNHKMWTANQTSVIRHKKPEFKRVAITDLPQISWVQQHIKYDAKDINWSDKLIAWYGFWLAEGCKSKNHRGSCYAHLDQKNPDKQLLSMTRSVGNYSKRVNKEGMTRFSFGKKFYDLVKEQGLSHQKYIPQKLKTASARQLKILIHWMMKGDGTDNKKLKRYNTSSKQLADDFQEICFKAGYVAKISVQGERLSKLPSGKIVIGRPIYHIYIRRGRKGSCLSQLRKNKINIGKYSGKTYCVETKSGVIYVRKNGKAFWCGQSWDGWKYFISTWLSKPQANRTRVPAYQSPEYFRQQDALKEQDWRSKYA